MVSFAGWQMPLFYTSIIDEYKHCRRNAVIFDVSHMGEFIFKGDIQSSGIEEAVTPWIKKIPIGKSRYGFILNEQGKIVDDFIVLKLKEDKLLFVVNAACRPADYLLLKQKLKSGSLEDISDETAKIDLQGPDARQVLHDVFGLGEGLSYFSFSEYDYKGSRILISRTGYTGELGYEIFVPNKLACFVWQELAAHKKVKPAGLGARDILRIEMGYFLVGAELTKEVTPLQAGLDKFLCFDKDFTGKGALLSQKDKGLDKKIVAFSTISRKVPRFGYDIYSAGKKIGRVTSGTFSPLLSAGIGLGYIEPGEFKEIEIEDDKQSRFEAKIKDLPFYKSGSLKS